jgi:hypothetical protein
VGCDVHKYDTNFFFHGLIFPQMNTRTRKSSKYISRTCIANRLTSKTDRTLSLLENPTKRPETPVRVVESDCDSEPYTGEGKGL